jgi:hypothetical protein
MRFMVAKRLGVLSGLFLGLVLMIGVVQAGAAGATKVLKFSNTHSQATGVGFNANSNATPPLGSSLIITIHLQNVGSQFGKPSGTVVGRVLLDCTILAVNSQFGDGICSGIAHVPNGFFTFGGNGGFSNAKVNYYAITGGIGPYANDRGEIKVTNGANGNSSAVVTLYSP